MANKDPNFLASAGGGETIKTTRLHWVGIGIGILYWFLESAFDTFLFHQGSLLERILTPDPNELWMRILVISTLIIFSFYAQSLIDKRNRAEEEVRRLNEGLERLVIERTAQLEAVNKALKDEMAGRMEIEEALRVSVQKVELSEAWFRRLLESTPDAIVVTNSNGQIRLINAQAEKIFGYNWDELIGRPIETLIPERFREGHVRHRQDYYSAPRLRQIGTGLELYARHKDGTEFPVDISLSPVETGKGLNVIAIIRDITDRKTAEEVLKESEQKFRALIEKSYDGVMLVDISGIIKYASPGATRILGYRSSELVGRNAFDIMYPDDLQYTQNLFSHLIQNPAEVVTSQFRYRHKDGSWRWLEGTGTNLLAEPAVQAIVGNFSDISEQKRAEEEFQQNYNLLNAVIEGTTDAIFVKDLKGRYLLMNSAGARLIGRSVEEVVGKDDTELFAPEATGQIMEDDLNIMRSGETRTYEEELLATAGIKRTYLTTKAPYLDSQGNVIGLIGIARDITDRKQAEDEIRYLAKFPDENPNPVLRVSNDGRILYANMASFSLLNFWGCQIGQPLPDYWHKSIFSPYGSGSNAYIEVDLGDRTLSLDLLSIAGTDYVDLYGRDITEHKRAERALKDSEERFRSVVDSATDAIVLADSSGKIIGWNKGAQRIFGYPEEDLLGRPITILMPERYRDAHQRGLERMLSTGESHVIGKTVELYGLRKDGSEFPLELSLAGWKKGEAIFYNGIIRDITDRKEAEKEIHHLAYYDLLTDLPNRLFFRDSIDRAITSARTENRAFALLIVNLNRFKEINNTLGYQNGDVILRQTGERLQGIFQESGLVSRLGGDEFGLLLGGKDAGGAMQAAGMIMQRLEEPFSLEGFSLDISACIGISIFPGHGEDADMLIRRAYIAMHRAKTTESVFFVYTPESDQFIPERLALMGELRSAIGLNQLFLLYQPKVDLRTGRTLGVEALVRWQHPRSGIIPPDQFISLAERCGLIKQLTFWVLREALRQSRSWSQAGVEVSVAVNLSIKNLRTPLLLDQIRGLLSTWGVDPRRLRFEITESLIMADPKLTIEILKQLTLMGICFSIDDFGTGYSSLRYLQTLPVDEIKIDKSFVLNMMTDESSMKIVRSTIELAHSLGLNVTAEGVESREVFDKLTELGCDAAQGYFISRPIPQRELTEWLIRQGPGKQV